MSIQKVAVIGSGTMGNGIAHVFAQHGYHVSLIDISSSALERAIAVINKNLDRQVAKELITAAIKNKAIKNINTFTSLQEGVEGVQLVIEAATENLATKLELFKKLDSILQGRAILATNTSSISITKLASATTHPEKVIGMHFMNPVPVMKLVEVIRGYNTSNDVTKVIIELSEKIDKHPVEVNDYPGFIANRILLPMINEAINALFEGVAGVKEIDAVMKLGMGHPMGPLQLADFIGLDVCLSILNVLHDGYKNPKYAPCPLLVNMVEAGHKGVKTNNGFYQYIPGSKDLVVAEQFRK